MSISRAKGLMCLHNLYRNVSNQHNTTIFLLLIFLDQPYMFRATVLPILRSTFDCIYSFWYNAPTLLTTGALYQKLYIQSKSAPEVGRICRPKHVGLT
jgi:hypothetical protein